MEVKFSESILAVKQGDITQEDTDVIVNAANSGLRGGGGVDGAIHRAGGPKIMEECRKYDGCPPGQAVITTGGNLKAKHVIHTVGPIYRGGNSREADTLASAYRESMKLAKENDLKSVSFPSISTGAYGYPIKEASEIALGTVSEFLMTNKEIKLVNFVLFSEGDREVYEETLSKISSM